MTTGMLQVLFIETASAYMGSRRPVINTPSDGEAADGCVPSAQGSHVMPQATPETDLHRHPADTNETNAPALVEVVKLPSGPSLESGPIVP
jgi:hypothetical protein